MATRTAFVFRHGGWRSPQEGAPISRHAAAPRNGCSGRRRSGGHTPFPPAERRNRSSADKGGPPRSFSSRRGPLSVPRRSLHTPPAPPRRAVPSTALTAPHPLLTHPPPQAHKGEREAVEKERAPLIPPARPLRKGSAHRRTTAARTTPGGAAVRGAGAAAELARLCACSEGGGAAVQGGGTAGAGG